MTDLDHLIDRDSPPGSWARERKMTECMRMKPELLALGRLPVGKMNKTEAAYEQEVLIPLRNAGKIDWYRFEGMKFRLADNTFYTPDFAVMTSDALIELHEVKGHWMDDARVKIKVAAAQYPFQFIAVKREAKKRGGGWKQELF